MQGGTKVLHCRPIKNFCKVNQKIAIFCLLKWRQFHYPLSCCKIYVTGHRQVSGDLKGNGILYHFTDKILPKRLRVFKRNQWMWWTSFAKCHFLLRQQRGEVWNWVNGNLVVWNAYWLHCAVGATLQLDIRPILKSISYVCQSKHLAKKLPYRINCVQTFTGGNTMSYMRYEQEKYSTLKRIMLFSSKRLFCGTGPGNSRASTPRCRGQTCQLICLKFEMGYQK